MTFTSVKYFYFNTIDQEIIMQWPSIIFLLSIKEQRIIHSSCSSNHRKSSIILSKLYTRFTFLFISRFVAFNKLSS